jgi:hypothetical protein
MKPVYAAVAVLGLLVPVASWAADARHPYTNVNPRNDAGNDTGDSQVDRLNEAQLQRPGAVAVPAYPAPVYAPPAYAPPVYAPPGYYYPPPVYYAPPPVPYYYRPY